MANFDDFTPIYLASYAIFVAIRSGYDKKGAAGARPDALEMILMALVAIGVMIVPLLFVFTPLVNRFNFQPDPLLQGVGSVIMVASLILFWLAHVDLGRNFSRTLEVKDGHTLITRGVYRHMRHPMYGAIWLFALGQSLLLPNAVAAFSGLIGFAPMYFLRTPREERMMCERFGSDYEDYMRRTPRLIPRLFARGR